MTTTTELELWAAGRVADELGIVDTPGRSKEREVWRLMRQGRLPSPLPIEGSQWIRVWSADDIRPLRGMFA